MVASLEVSASTGANVEAMQKLAELVALRKQYISKELTEDSVTATALNVVTSLKALTRKPKADSVPESAYTIKPTNLYGGYSGRSRAVVARVGSSKGARSNIRPAMGFDANSASVIGSRVYAIYTTNPYDTFAKNVNAPDLCWYVLCQHEGQAEAYAKRHVGSILRREGGMAVYALAKAQAKIYNKAGGSAVEAPSGNKQFQIASEAAVITKQAGNGEFSITVDDQLRYSANALQGESAAFTTALKKAANRTAGILRNFCDNHPELKLGKPETPFPEIKGK